MRKLLDLRANALVTAMLALFIVLISLPPRALSAEMNGAVQQILADAQSEIAHQGGCESASTLTMDRLARILCQGSLRIGVRDGYPHFGVIQDGVRTGYDVDVGRAIAARLGVAAQFETVKPADRIPKLADGTVDLVIATLGHNTQRDREVRFIRPHYYRSETILVGAKRLPVRDWADVAGRSICVSIGNGSNAQMVSRGARLMLFDGAHVLPERLQDGTCMLAAQDDSFFASYLSEARFAAGYEAKLGFAQVPWGMAVARDGSAQLAEALDALSRMFHRDGVFLRLAEENRIRPGFLIEQQALWRQPSCNGSSPDAAECLLPPLDAALEPTSFAAEVQALETLLQARLGLRVNLAMLKTVPAWTLFLAGLTNALVLVAGALVATAAFALMFGAMFVASPRPVRWLAGGATMALQSSPIVLTLVIVAAVAQSLFAYSTTVALGATAVALGLANGCNAGQAIGEAYRTLQATEANRALRDTPHAEGSLFGRALRLAAMQIISFLVNATKGTPIAAFVGAPELLGALTDITAFASGRVTTYALVLAFYILVVMAVMWACARLRTRLAARPVVS